MTMQATDSFIWEGEKWIFHDAENIKSLFDPKEYGLNPEMHSTACYKGFIVQFNLIRNQLFLDELRVFCGENYKYPHINGVEPCQPHTYDMYLYKGINKPLSYTGVITIGNKIINRYYGRLYIHTCAYRNVYELTFENGFLTSQKEILLWAKCPKCHNIGRVGHSDRKNSIFCVNCQEDFDGTHAEFYKEILIKDVKKEEVQRIEYSYSVGDYRDGYNYLLAYPSSNGGTAIQSKWTAISKKYPPPIFFESFVWKSMLDALFEEAKFTTWEQEGYSAGIANGTEWCITLTLSDNRVVYCNGCHGGHPPEWIYMHQFYEIAMTNAKNEYFDLATRQEVLKEIHSKPDIEIPDWMKKAKKN